MTNIECSTVEIVITDMQQNVVYFTIPAYTVSDTEFRTRAAKLLDDYISASKSNGDPVSLGDFALCVIVAASLDPHEITK